MAGKNTSRKSSRTRRIARRATTKSTRTSSKRSFNFASNFRSAVNRGTPAPIVVWNLSQKTGKSQSWIWNHLFSNKLVNRRKFNGSWLYWPSFQKKSQNNNKTFSMNVWQQIACWAVASGFCTPEQIASLKSQKDFINFFGPFFSQNWSWSVNSGWTLKQVKSFGQKKTAKSKAKPKAKSRAKSTRKSRSAAKKSRTTRAKRRTATTRVKRNTKRTSVKRASTKRTGVKRSNVKRGSTITKRSTRTTTRRSRTIKARKSPVTRTFKFPTVRTRSLRKAA